LKSESERHESRIQFNEERLREFGEQNSKALADMTQAEERSLVAQQELAMVREHLAKADAALAKHRQTLAERQAAVRQVEQDLVLFLDVFREAQAEAFSAGQVFSRIRMEITALDLQ
jgi:chromosome segregation ATPase